MEFMSTLISASFHKGTSLKLEKRKGRGIILLTMKHFRTTKNVCYISQSGILLNSKNLIVESK